MTRFNSIVMAFCHWTIIIYLLSSCMLIEAVVIHRLDPNIDYPLNEYELINPRILTKRGGMYGGLLGKRLFNMATRPYDIF